VAERINAFLGAGFFFIAARAAECSVEIAFAKGVQKLLGLQQAAAALGAEAQWVRSIVQGLLVGVDDQPDAQLPGELVPELYHFLELIGGIDVQQRKGDRTRVKRLLGEAKHYGRIVTDRIQHHRALKLGGNFAENLDALGFESL